LYTYVFRFIYMSNVSIRECFSVLNMSIVCIRNTARSKSIPLLCTHVDPYKFSTVHPPRTSSKSKLLTSQHVSHTWLQSMWSTRTLIMYPGSHFDNFVIWDFLIPKTEMVWCLLVDLCQWKLRERFSRHWVIFPEQELLRRVSQHRPSSTCWLETRQKHGTWFSRTSVRIDNTNAFLVFVKWRKVCIPVWGAIYFDFPRTMNPFSVECWEVE